MRLKEIQFSHSIFRLQSIYELKVEFGRFIKGMNGITDAHIFV